MNSNKPSVTIFGLGRMGAQIARRLHANGHKVYAWNRADEPELLKGVADAGVFASSDMAEVIAKSENEEHRIFWVMLPHSIVEEFIFGKENLGKFLKIGDIVIDGGNSPYEDSVRRAAKLEENGVFFFDCGTSGGVWGEANGFALMVGGPKEQWPIVAPIFGTLSPDDKDSYVGKSGAGHFVKMVHNAIEYVMMLGIAQGYALLDASPFELDLAKVTGIYQGNSVVRSWLIDLTKNVYDAGGVDDFSGRIDSNGEAEWAIKAAKNLGVNFSSAELSVLVRKESQNPENQEEYANKLQAALRNQFGGHAIHKKK